MDTIQKLRRTILTKYLKENMLGLEVGAFTRPTVIQSDIKKMYYADYFNTSQLKEMALKNGMNKELVVDVDYVVQNSDQIKELNHKFDILVLNHVLEHLIDPFRWLKEAEDRLNNNGLIFITLPDKKFSFDKFRPDTSLSHFISDFIEGGHRSLSEHCIESHLLYNHNYVNKTNIAQSRFIPENIKQASTNHFPGIHAHVFQAESFKETVLLPFLELGYINYECIEYQNNIDIGEFSFILRKKEKSENISTKAFTALYNTAKDTHPIKTDIYNTKLLPKIKRKIKQTFFN